MQYVARGMAERGDGGAIVNVSSVAACTVLKDHLAYCETLQLTLLTAVLHTHSLLLYRHLKSGTGHGNQNDGF